MASPQASRSLEELMSEASHNVKKLPVALISCGVSLSAAALSLIFKALGGTFGMPSGATVHLFYGFLVVVVIFGLVEASFGYWVVPRDLDGWRATAKTMLWFSIFPLVVVAALGGFVF
ncbi:hypothetical protein BAE44_0002745 [Dichanthelium oligosanthes]|uniref:Uncharacterized protein n=1 Tax=Dichanthelium oligosanthes TaxID=888268 RepID=A0A1E5WFQ8_9POAL|nr:hypothetical protein BAE44_0002745 [Dichanthelium oligosanthes]